MINLATSAEVLYYILINKVISILKIAFLLALSIFEIETLVILMLIFCMFASSRGKSVFRVFNQVSIRITCLGVYTPLHPTFI